MSDTAQTPNSNTPSNNTKDSKDPVQTVISNENDILLSPVQLEQAYSQSASPVTVPSTTTSSASISKSVTPTSSLDSMPRISITPTISQLKNTTKKVGKTTTTTNNNTSTSTTTKVKSSKRKHKKNICFYPDCTKLSAKFIGDCNFCNGHFCSNHRLMESHNCKGLDNCKEQLHQRNADKLNKEQTIVPKIQI
ncbi:AN1-type zinc finger protein Tmc1p [Monosporozyma unispora]|nr:hypothetical protein C6P44_004523 [Kazachstania unispora]